MSALLAAAAVAIPASPPIAACTLSGSLDATAVAGTANSASITVTVPSGNSGDISFETFIDVGTITTSRYNKASAGLVTYTDATTVTFADGNSLVLQTNSVGAGESRTVTMRDVTTGATIATVVHTGA